MQTITEPINHSIRVSMCRLLEKKSIVVDDCSTPDEAQRTPIDMLIGMDVLMNFLTGEKISLSKHLCAVNSIVGWCIAGVEATSFSSPPSSSPVVLTTHASEPAVDLSRLWAGEDLSKEEEAVSSDIIREVEETIEFRENRYWVGLPWLRLGQFDDNFASALHRLRSMVDRLKAQETYAAYQTELMQLVADGHAERVPTSRSAGSYFMPHRGVWREGALTTKPRVVFDASSHRRNQDPLNARLTKGVDLNPSIASMMIKFRIGKVAAIADLQKAFLQIRIISRDRDFLRFLWIDSDGRLVSYQMTSVPFGATCSPFLLAVIIRFHLLRYQSTHPSVRSLLGNIYVDDLIVTADSIDEMRALHDDSVELFKKCSMQLHKWRVSDAQLDGE